MNLAVNIVAAVIAIWMLRLRVVRRFLVDDWAYMLGTGATVFVLNVLLNVVWWVCALVVLLLATVYVFIEPVSICESCEERVEHLYRECLRQQRNAFVEPAIIVHCGGGGAIQQWGAHRRYATTRLMVVVFLIRHATLARVKT